MSHNRSILRIPTLLSLVLAGALALPATAMAKPPGGGSGGGSTTTPIATSYAGRAYGLSAAATALADLVKVGPIVLSDTGELPSAGGDVERSLLTANVALSGVSLDADVVDAVVVGSGLTTDANAETVGLTGGVDGLLTISAGVIQAQSTATCTSTGPVYAGNAHLANIAVTLLGQPVAIAADPAPNTTINLLNGVVKIVLNEQTMSGGRLVVNALHITVNGALSLLSTVATADIVVSHAEAGISCANSTTGGGSCPVKDFVTGGGQLVSSTGAGVSFGFVGGLKSPGLMGHFNAVDHGTGQHIQGSSVSAYTITGPTSRQITYDNGALVVNATDNGEPGTNDALSFTGGYNGTPIASGNIQLHQPAGCPATNTSGGGKKH